MELIEIFSVGQIVEIQLQIHPFAERMARHRVEQSVAGDLLHEPGDRVRRRGSARRS